MELIIRGIALSLMVAMLVQVSMAGLTLKEEAEATQHGKNIAKSYDGIDRKLKRLRRQAELPSYSIELFELLKEKYSSGLIKVAPVDRDAWEQFISTYRTGCTSADLAAIKKTIADLDMEWIVQHQRWKNMRNELRPVQKVLAELAYEHAKECMTSYSREFEQIRDSADQDLMQFGSKLTIGPFERGSLRCLAAIEDGVQSIREIDGCEDVLRDHLFTAFLHAFPEEARLTYNYRAATRDEIVKIVKNGREMCERYVGVYGELFARARFDIGVVFENDYEHALLWWGDCQLRSCEALLALPQEYIIDLVIYR